jgi:hypothetical protein
VDGLWFSTNECSRELATYAGQCLQRIFRPQHQYKRAGVMLMDLCRRETAQPMLFEHRDLEASNRLMALMDRINRDHGRGDTSHCISIIHGVECRSYLASSQRSSVTQIHDPVG